MNAGQKDYTISINERAKKLSAIHIRIMETTDEIKWLKRLNEGGKLKYWIEKKHNDLIKFMKE